MLGCVVLPIYVKSSLWLSSREEGTLHLSLPWLITNLVGAARVLTPQLPPLSRQNQLENMCHDIDRVYLPMEALGKCHVCNKRNGTALCSACGEVCPFSEYFFTIIHYELAIILFGRLSGC